MSQPDMVYRTVLHANKAILVDCNQKIGQKEEKVRKLIYFLELCEPS